MYHHDLGFGLVISSYICSVCVQVSCVSLLFASHLSFFTPFSPATSHSWITPVFPLCFTCCLWLLHLFLGLCVFPVLLTCFPWLSGLFSVFAFFKFVSLFILFILSLFCLFRHKKEVTEDLSLLTTINTAPLIKLAFSFLTSLFVCFEFGSVSTNSDKVLCI